MGNGRGREHWPKRVDERGRFLMRLVKEHAHIWAEHEPTSPCRKKPIRHVQRVHVSLQLRSSLSPILKRCVPMFRLSDGDECIITPEGVVCRVRGMCPRTHPLPRDLEAERHVPSQVPAELFEDRHHDLHLGVALNSSEACGGVVKDMTEVINWH